ncbi:hypothetical protein BpHYR1_000509 [Brachionus plicatilis]|uniref:Uncharacterized protein n=1 Tax=Brachionus plicatilis TaxID=10195 RepID=A0A3M7R1D0_BRAPC|nr:hypothetical protein BpHYR1_000509 [Brachionus plicatilis]
MHRMWNFRLQFAGLQHLASNGLMSSCRSISHSSAGFEWSRKVTQPEASNQHLALNLLFGLQKLNLVFLAVKQQHIDSWSDER